MLQAPGVLDDSQPPTRKALRHFESAKSGKLSEETADKSFGNFVDALIAFCSVLGGS